MESAVISTICLSIAINTAYNHYGPGPGNYALPPTLGYQNHDITKKRNPAYTIGYKTSLKMKDQTPGPYMLKQNYNRFGRSYNPAFSIAARTTISAKSHVPGPGTYAPEKCPLMKERRPPKFSIGAHTGVYKAERSPGPNKYSLPSTVGKSPKYSIAGKLGDIRSIKSPGPAQYGPTNLNVYKLKAPRVTVTGRTAGVSDKSRTPGPAAYNPGYMPGKRRGQISFGIKHSNKTVPLILEEDEF